MNSKKLSIIVPVYNVEEYLSKCLDSLLQQNIDCDNYEVIIINDGSTDGSLSIAESYVSRFRNIRLYNQDNKGLGAARNVGLQNANGKYVFFVDSDDYIVPYSLGELLASIETNRLDVLRFNYQNVDEAGKIIPKRKNATYSIVFNENIVDGETFLSEYLGWACYACMFLFDTSFLKTSRLLFDENIYFEDVEWLIRVLLLAKRVKSIDKSVYCYLQRSGSITHSVLNEKKNKIISDKLYIIDLLVRLSRTTYNRKLSMWCKGMISLTYMGILAYVENEFPERKSEVIELIYQNKLFPFRPYNFTIKQKRDLFFVNLSPRLYCYLRRKS